MARLIEHPAALAAGLVLLLASCRSILDINPGSPLEEADGASGGKASGGKSNGSMGGSAEEGGAPDPGGSGRGGSGTAGKGDGGTSKGGSGQGGTSDAGGGGAGGDGGTPPVSPFPEGACRDCIARNCPAQAEECSNDADCASGIPAWLSCSKTDANECVSPEAGPLRALETCGAESCDLCRHRTDGEPSIEILTPSNGAELLLDASGLIEVSVRVSNVALKTLGQCGIDTKCGHVHLNLDGVNCRKTGFYNEWIVAADAEGFADSIIDTQYCVESVLDRPIKLTASLSNHATHQDRIPLVQSTVTVTVTSGD
jgi:hypothetical protein